MVEQKPEKRETGIVLYTDNTPNGQKIAITLEELGLKYETIHVDISTNVQKEEWFLKINPNGRIPAIVDKTPGPNGETREKRVFEGSAIQLYLAAKFDEGYKISYPYDSDRYWEVVEWMTWVQSGVGPMQGQANHFFRYAPEKIEYAVNRYQTETKRLYSILEERLKGQKAQSTTAAGTDAASAGAEGDSDGPWIVGGKLTIADLCAWSWIQFAPWAGISFEPFPEVKKWQDKIRARPAVDRGLNEPLGPWENEKKIKGGDEELAKHSREWVQKGMKDDAEKHK